MIAYIYWSENKIINCKIENVISISDGQIIGDSTSIFNSSSQNYIILQSDTINLNVGQEIDLSGFEDERDYFLKGKEAWLQKKIENANNRLKALETIPNLPTRVTSNEQDIDISEDTLNSILVDILPKLMA